MNHHNRITKYLCTHPRLRAVDYDDDYHWVVTCPDCGHLGSMTQAEWRAAHGKKTLSPSLFKRLVKDEGAESGRAVIQR